jgi:hypothetical protein
MVIGTGVSDVPVPFDFGKEIEIIFVVRQEQPWRDTHRQRERDYGAEQRRDTELPYESRSHLHLS